MQNCHYNPLITLTDNKCMNEKIVQFLTQHGCGTVYRCSVELKKKKIKN